jgi:hypothetical protein
MVTAKRTNGELVLEVPQKIYDFVLSVKEGENMELSPSTLLTGGKSFLNSFFKKS